MTHLPPGLPHEVGGRRNPLPFETVSQWRDKENFYCSRSLQAAIFLGIAPAQAKGGYKFNCDTVSSGPYSKC
jgi:hypothetical protein